MKRSLISITLVLLVACGKDSGDPGSRLPEVYVRPNPPVPVRIPRTEQDSMEDRIHAEAVRVRGESLKRFSPAQIRDVYHAFRPLRGENVKRSQIDGFLKANNLTENELRAILEEGDRLGWSEPAE